VHESELLKSVAFGQYGIFNFEGGFHSFIKRIEDKEFSAKLLESESGAVVGCITLCNDTRWAKKTYILDMFVHNNFVFHYDTLLNSIELPEGKIQCYIMAESPKEKIDALEQAGFEREALLKKQFAWGNEWYDVILLALKVVG
jgi:hypothetical protein